MAAAAVAAVPCAEPKKDEWIGWQIQEENDFLSGEDDFYTQGLLLTLTRHTEATPKWAECAGQWLWRLLYPRREADVVLSYEIGQHIFTPEDLAPSELIVDDRPYAGYLYGGVLLTVTDDADRDDPVQQIFELQFGVVGPESGAEWTQTRLHELIGSREPAGWDNQLPFEPALQLIYLWRRPIGSNIVDVVPHLGGGLGNLQIFANAGATFRLGKNLSQFPVRINRTTLFVDSTDWDGYVFIGADGRLVGRNLFLDGSTFKDSHSVDSESFVYDLKAGFSLRYKRFRFNYTFVRRSREFAPLPAGRSDGEHEFGAFSFAFDKTF